MHIDLKINYKIADIITKLPHTCNTKMPVYKLLLAYSIDTLLSIVILYYHSQLMVAPLPPVTMVVRV